jgi:hypothetical protein
MREILMYGPVGWAGSCPGDLPYPDSVSDLFPNLLWRNCLPEVLGGFDVVGEVIGGGVVLAGKKA